jgi:hypothetical protein
MNRTFQWINLVLAVLVVIGVFVQVYLIASYIFGAGTDALDAHKNIGGIVHLAEVLVFISALFAYWGRWGEIALSFSLGVVGTIQLSFASGDKWVGGFHGLLALFILVLAAIISRRTMRELGIGPDAPPRAPV